MNKDEKLEYIREGLYEIPASLFFVLFIFSIIEYKNTFRDSLGPFMAPLLFACVYFFVVWVLSARSIVHILPVISFVHALKEGSLHGFLARLTGQLLGALAAALLYFLGLQFGIETDLSVAFEPLHPFYLGLFTGLISQGIYLAYYFLFIRSGKSLNLKLFIFSIAFGSVFLLVSFLDGITLLNPFGMLFAFMLQGNPLQLNTLLVGITVHVLVPMLFIGGTHLFLLNVIRFISK